MQRNRTRAAATQRRRVNARASGWIFGGYAVLGAVASGLKAWQTAADAELDRLAKTNIIVWDTITLFAALAALALGVREMVLAYFMRKEYEEDLAALLQNQEAIAETARQQNEATHRQAEMIRQQGETVQALLADRDSRAAESQKNEEDRAALRQSQHLMAEMVQTFLANLGNQAIAPDEKDAVIARQEERIRQLEALLERQGNGNGNGHNQNDTASES